jgi:hypothetical protein
MYAGDAGAISRGNAIIIAPIMFSKDASTKDEVVTLRTTITGKTRGFILLFVGYYDEASLDLLLKTWKGM